MSQERAKKKAGAGRAVSTLGDWAGTPARASKAVWDWVRLELPRKTVQAMTLPVYEKLGYKFEGHRAGDTQVGLLRRTFNRPGRKPQALRRLVFLPGFGDSPVSWMPVFALLQPALKRRFDEVILVEYPGSMGYLHAEKPFSSFDHQIQVVFDLLDGLRPQVVFGHSLGGWLAASYSIACGRGERPSKTTLQYKGPEKIILANPSGVLADEKKKEEWLNRFRKARDRGSKHFRQFLFGQEPFWFGAVAESFMGFLDKKEVHDFMDSVAERHLVNDHLDSIESKTWVLWGATDTLVPSEWVHDWLERLNHPPAAQEAGHSKRARRGMSHGVIIQGAGHSPHLERPVTTAAALGKILLGHAFQPSTQFWERVGWQVLNG
ncbi:MAG TPA: alpha/beta hydrolase [Bdellovibrionota bacterium]|jgi:pimeloyl-ACP methyl ester carboxylesterase|nr:alpha/beta hydrolase [Bdellovibrionota bacterium]